MTKIIAGYPGVGKSHYSRNHPDETVLDSDSSSFSWTTSPDGSRSRNHEFPQNYIEHIKQNVGTAAIIFVSTHAEVRDALAKNGIDFVIVYPDSSLKEEYLQRFRERGDSQTFIDLMVAKWDEWHKELEELNAKRVVLQSGEHMDDAIDRIDQEEAKWMTI